MPSETVKVMVRVRPFNERERTKGAKNCVEVEAQNCQITIMNSADADLQKVFSYDAVFPPNISQQAVYEEAGFKLVESVLDGYNGTIFAYGQTGCGKTHTMMGNPAVDSLRGIIPRAFEHIFGKIESSGQKNYLIRCSYIEIYNEEIHDLIGKNWNNKLELKENPDKGVFIKDVSMVVVKSVKEIEQLMDLGMRSRTVGETAMNKDSSRSHSIFTIYIEASELDEKGQQRITAGKLNLVDLAGSERQSKTQATGDRLKEANKINLSLSALGNVISALVDGKSSHIPYRDSKLTRLLQDSLGGNTKTVMVANVSPANDSYDETLGTLRYASRAKNIKNQPKVNEDPKDALLREYAEEIKKLRDMLSSGADPSTLLQGKQIKVPSVKDLDRSPSKKNTAKLAEYENEIKMKEQQINDERMKRERLEDKLREIEETMLKAGKAQEGGEKKKYEEMVNKVKTKEATKTEDVQTRQLKEEEVLLGDGKYNSLQEEVEEQRKLIRKLRKKYKGALAEIKDLEREHELNREDLFDTIRLLEKDIKINNSIMLNLLSPEELNKVRARARWRDDRNEFYIPPFVVTNKKAKFPKLPHHQGVAMMKDEWQNRELEFQGDDENPDDEYGYDEDFEEDPHGQEKPVQRPPSNRKDFKVKGSSMDPIAKSNRASGDNYNINYNTINYNVPQNRNVSNKPSNLTGAGTNRYNPAPDYHENFNNQGYTQDRIAAEKNSKQMYQKNAKNVMLTPLNNGNIVGNSTPNLMVLKQETQGAKNSVDNFPTLNKKNPPKQLAPIKENGNNNPRAIKVNFKATLVYGNEMGGSEDFESDMNFPMPKGKIKLQAIDRGIN